MNKPTESEIEILQVLWDKGPCTVREVNEVLSAIRNKEVGYTTTLKLMQIMADKGILERDVASRTHVYKPVLEKHKIQNGLLEKFIDTIFNGSSADLVMKALTHKKASKKELDEIRKYLDKLDNKD